MPPVSFAFCSLLERCAGAVLRSLAWLSSALVGYVLGLGPGVFSRPLPASGGRVP